MASVATEIAKEHLDKFPDTPSLTLAKKIYKENPAVYKTIESARSSIRRLRGQNGDFHRQALKDKTYVKPPGKRDPFECIPEGIKEYSDWGPHPINVEKLLLLFDTHIPFHDKQALILALKHGKREGVDGICFAGDTYDFYAESFWVRDPRMRNFKEELHIGYEVFDIIRDIFPDQKMIFKLGNHEERHWRYMKVKAPELMSLEIAGVKDLIRADKYNLEVVDERRVVKFGKLNIIHGHEFGKGVFSPVNPARTFYLKGKENAIGGHYHQTSEHTAKSMNENITACWSAGCLCDLHPAYAPMNNWNLGFAVVKRRDSKGNFYIDNLRIIDGEVY